MASLTRTINKSGCRLRKLTTCASLSFFLSARLTSSNRCAPTPSTCSFASDWSRHERKSDGIEGIPLARSEEQTTKAAKRRCAPHIPEHRRRWYLDMQQPISGWSGIHIFEGVIFDNRGGFHKA